MDQNNSTEFCNSYCPSSSNSTFTSSNGLFLVSFNIRSDNTNGDSFLDYINKSKILPDVIVSSEIYFSDTYNGTITGLRSFNPYRSINSKGGESLFCRDSLDFRISEVNNVSSETIEFVHVELDILNS